MTLNASTPNSLTPNSMTDTAKPTVAAAHPTYEQRKKALIAEGAMRRREIDHAQDIVRANLHADVIAKNAVSHFTTAAYAAVDNIFSWNSLRNGNLQTLLPFAASAYSLVTKRRLVVPILRGAVVVSAIGGAVYLLARKKKAPRVATVLPVSPPDYLDPGV